MSCCAYKSAQLKNGDLSFIMKKGAIQFSFEYPSRYKIGHVEIDDTTTNIHTGVSLGWDPVKERAKDLGPTTIQISLDSGMISNAEVALSESMSLSQRVYHDFLLLEEFQDTIDGNSGLGAVFTWTALPNPLAGVPGAVTKSMISREIYFIVGKFTGTISISSDVSNRDIDKDSFELILKTFKILNN